MAKRKSPDKESQLEDGTYVGRTITHVRPLSDDELSQLGWEDTNSHAVVIQLDDGTLLFPSRDEEGNGPGCMFVQTPARTSGGLFVKDGKVVLL